MAIPLPCEINLKSRLILSYIILQRAQYEETNSKINWTHIYIPDDKSDVNNRRLFPIKIKVW